MPAPIPQARILEATLEVWREEGYRAATTQKIAQRAGVGEVTLFRRFGAKSDLFAAALAQESERLASVDLRYTGDVERDILGIATAYAQIVDRNAAIILDFLRSAPGNSELATVGTVPLAMIGRLASIVARHQGAGALRGGSPHDVVVALLSPILMKRLLLGAQPGITWADDLTSAVRLFLNGYGTAES